MARICTFPIIQLLKGKNLMKGFIVLIILVFVILTVSTLTLSGCSAEQFPIATQSSLSTPILAQVVKEVKWNLSGLVMPKPQYGSRDISGSDRASSLTVNQTEKQVQITAEMNGLNKNTEYRVLLAKAYTPNSIFPGLFKYKEITFTFKTDATGSYSWTFIIFNSDFPEPGKYSLSLWTSEIEPNITVLISDNFDINIK